MSNQPKSQKFVVEVSRTYVVTDQIEVVANSPQEAEKQAEQISDDKDYSGKLQLDEVTTLARRG